MSAAGSWKTVKSEKTYECPWFSVRHDVVISPFETSMDYFVVDHPFQSVVVVPVRRDGRILFLAQLRYTTGRFSWELPAGGLQPGETTTVAAIRELREETGLRVKETKLVGQLQEANGFSSNVVQIVYASVFDDTVASSPSSDDVIVQYSWWTLDQVWAQIARGVITDGLAIAALALSIAKGFLKSD